MVHLTTNLKVNIMKLNISLFIALIVAPFSLLAQENDTIPNNDTIIKKKVQLQRAAFESSMIIENPTSVVNTKGTLETMIQHRFGLVSGKNDMIGIWAPSNIRLGVVYSFTDRISAGFGTTKDSRLQDFSLKGALLRQTKDDKMPVNVTYYGDAAYNATTGIDFNKATDRWSYFNQLIISRRFTSKISAQIAPSFSHYNVVESTMKNDMWGLAIGGRAVVSPAVAILVDYSQPLTSFEKNTPKAGFSLGAEYSTGSHAFQLFITNYRAIVPQQNYMYNQNDFFDGDFVIGFNMTRLFHM